jgi:hypothetical protein
MEVIFRTYEQVPEQGVFDIVILFCPRGTRQFAVLDGILARGQCRGRILAVDGAPAAGQGDDRVRQVGRLEFPGVVRGLLSGSGGGQ